MTCWNYRDLKTSEEDTKTRVLPLEKSEITVEPPSAESDERDITYWIQDIHRISPGGFILWEVTDDTDKDDPRILAAGRIEYIPEIHSYLTPGDWFSREGLFDLIRGRCHYIWSGSQLEYLPENNIEGMD